MDLGAGIPLQYYGMRIVPAEDGALGPGIYYAIAGERK